MWNLKSAANKLVCKAETDSQTRSPDLWRPAGGGAGAGGLGVGSAGAD